MGYRASDQAKVQCYIGRNPTTSGILWKTRADRVDSLNNKYIYTFDFDNSASS